MSWRGWKFFVALICVGEERTLNVREFSLVPSFFLFASLPKLYVKLLIFEICGKSFSFLRRWSSLFFFFFCFSFFSPFSFIQYFSHSIATRWWWCGWICKQKMEWMVEHWTAEASKHVKWRWWMRQAHLMSNVRKLWWYWMEKEISLCAWKWKYLSNVFEGVLRGKDKSFMLNEYRINYLENNFLSSSSKHFLCSSIVPLLAWRWEWKSFSSFSLPNVFPTRRRHRPSPVSDFS